MTAQKLDATNKALTELLSGDNSSVNVDIKKAHEKYVGFSDKAIQYITLFKFLSNSYVLRKFDNVSNEMIEFTDKISKLHTETFTFNTSRLDSILASYPMMDNKFKPTIDEFITLYNNVKDSELLQIILDTCNVLVTYKSYLSQKTVSDKFIIGYKGNYLSVSKYIPLNIKFIYLGSNDECKKMLLLFLNKLYTISYELYDIYGKSDLNLESFTKTIHIAIADLRKRVPRCDMAFNIIEKSSGLLEENYDSYYKDYVSTNNHMIITENFIQDVIKNIPNQSPKLMSQFRRIMTELGRLKEKAQISNPAYKKILDGLFDSVNGDDEITKSIRKNEEDADVESSDGEQDETDEINESKENDNTN